MQFWAFRGEKKKVKKRIERSVVLTVIAFILEVTKYRDETGGDKSGVSGFLSLVGGAPYVQWRSYELWAP